MNQKGFTLIELIMVIVILGILAATAIPRFIDLSDQADQAAVEGVAGALSAGAAINYASAKAESGEAVAVADCASVASTLQGGLPTGYNISGGAVAPDASVTCTVTSPDGASANFTAIGVSV